MAIKKTEISGQSHLLSHFLTRTGTKTQFLKLSRIFQLAFGMRKEGGEGEGGEGERSFQNLKDTSHLMILRVNPNSMTNSLSLFYQPIIDMKLVGCWLTFRLELDEIS